MKLVLAYVNAVCKFIGCALTALIALAAVIGYMTVVSVVWAINPLAGLGLLGFGLLIVWLVAYC